MTDGRRRAAKAFPASSRSSATEGASPAGLLRQYLRRDAVEVRVGARPRRSPAMPTTPLFLGNFGLPSSSMVRAELFGRLGGFRDDLSARGGDGVLPPRRGCREVAIVDAPPRVGYRISQPGSLVSPANSARLIENALASLDVGGSAPPGGRARATANWQRGRQRLLRTPRLHPALQPRSAGRPVRRCGRRGPQGSPGRLVGRAVRRDASFLPRRSGAARASSGCRTMSDPVQPRRIALMLESDGPGRRRNHADAAGRGAPAAGALRAVCVGPDNGCGWLGGELRRRGFTTDVFTLRQPIDRGLPPRHGGDACARHRIEVVHSHEFTMAVYGAAAAAPDSASPRHHDAWQRDGLSRWQRRIALRLAFAASRAVVAVSRATHAHMAQVMRMAPGSFLTIPNGIALHARTPPRRARRTGPHGSEDVLVLAVGTWSVRKGHIHLLRALSASTWRDTGWHVAIAGRGDEEETLAAFAAEAGVAERVHLLGHRGDIPDLLAAADVYAMPSLWEGLPMALLEAMFAGKAIVASRASGIPEAIDEGQEGLLAEPGDEGPVTEALGQVLADAGLRDRACRGGANARATREFSAAVMTDAYERAYGIRG